MQTQMPSSPENHEAHNYAERIRARLPRRLQELREAAGMSKYALATKAGVSRDMVGCIEGGRVHSCMSAHDWHMAWK